MSKKGLSADEKAAKLLGWFHSTKEFYALKDIEKTAAKACGLNSMIIKDVLQTLLDDSLVTVEKIGTSNYYWSYPGANAAKLQADHDTAKRGLAEAQKKLDDTQASFDLMKKARGGDEDEDETERQDLLKEYYEKQKRLEEIKEELSQFAEGDPAVYELKKKDVEAMKESALRWTDQTSTMIAYGRDHYNMEPDAMRQMLDLPDDFEDLAFP